MLAGFLSVLLIYVFVFVLFQQLNWSGKSRLSVSTYVYVGECEQVHVTLIECIVVDTDVAVVAVAAALGCFDQKIKTNAAHLLSDKAKSRSKSKSKPKSSSSFCFLFKFNERYHYGWWVVWGAGKALWLAPVALVRRLLAWSEHCMAATAATRMENGKNGKWNGKMQMRRRPLTDFVTPNYFDWRWIKFCSAFVARSRSSRANV